MSQRVQQEILEKESEDLFTTQDLIEDKNPITIRNEEKDEKLPEETEDIADELTAMSQIVQQEILQKESVDLFTTQDLIQDKNPATIQNEEEDDKLPEEAEDIADEPAEEAMEDDCGECSLFIKVCI